MKLFGKRHITLSIATFIIIFLMNKLGNERTDSLEIAFMNALAGVIGLSIGIFILYKTKDKDKHDNHFD